MSRIRWVGFVTKTLIAPAGPASFQLSDGLWREIAVNIEDHLRRVRDEDGDGTVDTGGDDGGVGHYRAFERVQGRDEGLRCAGRPEGQVRERPVGYCSYVERIGGGVRWDAAGA